MSLKRNFTYNIFYQILTMFLPLITTPYISRIIGVEGIGIYSYTYSIVSYFVLFAMLGVSNYGNRCIATARDNKEVLSKTFFNIYFLQLATSLCMLGIYCFYIKIYVSEYQSIYYIQLIFIISSILDINWLFFGLEQFKLTVTRNTIVKIFTVICIFVFVKNSQDLWKYTLIMASGTFISQFILWMFIRDYIVWVKPSIKEILKHIKPNLVLFIPVLAISIYKIMDKIMLGTLTTPLEVGYYENSEKIINIPISIITALGTVMLPRMTNLISQGKHDKVTYYIEKSLIFMLFMSIGTLVGLIGIGSTFIPIFLGEDFMRCIPITSLLGITVVFISWANVIRTQYLIPLRKDKIYIKSTFLGALFNVIGNIIFIPTLGAIGAAIGTIFAEASVAIYQSYKIRHELFILQYLKKIYIFILPASCMYGIMYVLNSLLSLSIHKLFILIIIGGGSYLLLSSIIIIITQRELGEELLYQVKKVIYNVGKYFK